MCQWIRREAVTLLFFHSTFVHRLLDRNISSLLFFVILFYDFRLVHASTFSIYSVIRTDLVVIKGEFWHSWILRVACIPTNSQKSKYIIIYFDFWELVGMRATLKIQLCQKLSFYIYVYKL